MTVPIQMTQNARGRSAPLRDHHARRRCGDGGAGLKASTTGGTVSALRRLQILMQVDEPEVERDRPGAEHPALDQLSAIGLQRIERRLESLSGEAHQQYLCGVALSEEVFVERCQITEIAGD